MNTGSVLHSLSPGIRHLHLRDGHLRRSAGGGKKEMGSFFDREEPIRKIGIDRTVRTRTTLCVVEVYQPG